MDNANDENLRKNLWQHQQHASSDNNQQFYGSQYQVRRILETTIEIPADVVVSIFSVHAATWI
jgi:hypothetical protein